ncbi:hypothetical protein JAAARDRAFT_34048 [Jaapia argillacea MUCL 33604]|uniref:Uncharacterized protein n=1 Tax=Jaapia argillacea MUCL 33604 TaxID=933084 RepID=A0A067Q743_9AGAM|nr:hypothetical protein JAAARDRAFT_34048 [Jaapia argillacea MUCL 33604]
MAEELQENPEYNEKFGIAKKKKETGDQAFKEGKLKDALWSYHEATMYLTGLNPQKGGGMPQINSNPQGQTEPAKPKTPVDEMLEKVYANMSACHINQKNWKRALETADKALSKNSDNYKALFRKGKALGELGYYDKAVVVLEDLLKKNPSDAPTINAELSRLRVIDKQREREANQKLKGFLSKDKALGSEGGKVEKIVKLPPVQSASIVELPPDATSAD